MSNPVLVIMIETFSLEEVGWGFAMVQICRVKLIPFASSQMNHAKPFFLDVWVGVNSGWCSLCWGSSLHRANLVGIPKTRTAAALLD